MALIVHPWLETVAQPGPVSETHFPGDSAPDAESDGQRGDLEEGYESENGESKGDDDGEWKEDYEISDDELREKMCKIEQLLVDKNFVMQLETHTETQNQFFREFGGYLGVEPPQNEGNVLHFMAVKFPSPFLIRHMLSEHKERMHDIDNARRQPLLVAIEVKNELFIETVLDSEYDDVELQRILGIRLWDSSNVIHAAIRNGLSPKLTINLISKVSSEMLTERDLVGRAPLHYAVEYERCTEAQLDVVKALLEKGDSVFDKEKWVKPSVYQYHFSTRPEEEKTAEITDALAGRSGISRSQILGQPPDLSQAAENKTDQKEETPDESSKTQPHNTGLERKLSLTAILKQEDGAKDIVPKTPTSLPNHQAQTARKATAASHQANARPRSGVPKRSSTTATQVSWKVYTKKVRSAAGNGVKNTPPVSKAFADRIANEVKLHYLRSTFKNDDRNHDTAVDFLYGDKQPKHICFNLLQKDKPMSHKSLTAGAYARFEFDTALQFVAVGPISIYKPGESAVPMRGRQDMVALFEWLEAKRVNHIVKVVVKDHKYPFHSDKAIIDALRRFSIDILDWSKPDLCPVTIRHACKGVRELHLSWSGLNGMLLAWGGMDGLANLPNLTDVHLRQINNLESEEWTTEKLDDFERRLNNARNQLNASQTQTGDASKSQSKDKLEDALRVTVHQPKVQANVNRQIVDDAGQPQNRETAIKDHQWLELMDRFSSGIFTLPPDEYVKSVPNLPAELQRDVRICLIDDGVDAEHKGTMERLDGGKAFGAYTRDEYRAMTMPFYDSTTNHGTLMASMMVRVCPFAKIVSYRLDTRQGEDRRVHFTAKSAADALEYAVKQDFDIISMSWTVKRETGPDEDNTRDITRINDALRQAVAKTLVFCSAPDTGDISPDELGSYYPVGSSIHELFRIGAANADNTPWPRAGGRNIVDYILPGHDVREKEGDEVIQNGGSLKSGSSIATALAAGLAALMIHVVRMAAIRTHEIRKDEDKEANVITPISLQTIKLPSTMRKTFDSMTSRTYVHVWSNFYQKGNELKAANDAEDPEAEKWKIIAELARDIVSSKMMRP